MAAAVSSRVQRGRIRAAPRATSAQPSSVQVSCLERARPAAIGAFAGGLAASSAAPPGRRRPERQRGAKAEGKTKDAAPGRVESLSVHGGCAARSGFAAVPLVARGPRQCRHVRVLRTTGHAGACRSAAMTDRRDDDFRVRPSAPKNRVGAGPELRFQGAQAGRQSHQRQVGGAPSGRLAPASGPARARGAATRQRASPGRR